ncbi:MAG: hypothetical protein EPN37_07110 [Chitinophagaceae bacterium]|nr:MAG: hypothetical protein EPN37_07110 [Chitinophagaceae bacterium]
MTFTINELISAAERELDSWKLDGEKQRTDSDYEKMGFVHAVAMRLQTSKPVSSKMPSTSGGFGLVGIQSYFRPNVRPVNE